MSQKWPFLDEKHIYNTLTQHKINIWNINHRDLCFKPIVWPIRLILAETFLWLEVDKCLDSNFDILDIFNPKKHKFFTSVNAQQCLCKKHILIIIKLKKLTPKRSIIYIIQNIIYLSLHNEQFLVVVECSSSIHIAFHFLDSPYMVTASLLVYFKICSQTLLSINILKAQ